MRFRTAAILSFVLIGGMFTFPMVMMTAANHYVEMGVVIPLYMRILFGVAFFFGSFKWFLSPLIIIALFLVATVSTVLRNSK